jgi:iron complex transport system ATP-binding protein
VLTREVVSQAFDLDALVIPDPLTSTPLVIPVPGGAHAAADEA